MNTVIAGDYKGKSVYLSARDEILIGSMSRNDIHVNKDTVERYEVMGAQSKSGFSFGKAALGAAAFGDVGVLAGANGKKKNTYQVAIYFRDGSQSLVEVDGKIYKAIMTTMFGVENYDVEAEAQKRQFISENKRRKTKRILLTILIYFVSLLICLFISSFFSQGKEQIGGIWALIVVAVPIVAAVIIPRRI